MIFFRLTDNKDPEERLEEAALWKAMHDEYGEAIGVLSESNQGSVCFGRQSSNVLNYVSDHLPYWDDPAFLRHVGRRFAVVDYEGLRGAITQLHGEGLGAFVKSTRSKHFICRVPVGTDLVEAMGAMAYSFMDGGPNLMVQQLVEPSYEYRFFCVGRQIITESPINPLLTPIDFPLPSHPPVVVSALRAVAASVASDMRVPHASIDCALIDGHPGVIELNPMILGNLGLYACDIRALARASRKLLSVGMV